MLCLLTGVGCARSERPASPQAPAPIVGAWRSSVHFRSGAFAAIKDLEFMYALNVGGTMTESSNHDGAPPVPPAYGMWRQVGPREFEARYEFYATKAPATASEILTGGGWSPAGRGVFHERLVVSEDGQSFTSTIRYDAFDLAGAPSQGSGEGDGKGVKIKF